MARNHANNGRIYRAVVVSTYQDGSSVTSMYGPYDTKGAAKAQITSAARRAAESQWYPSSRNAHWVAGHVESAEVIWMREA